MDGTLQWTGKSSEQKQYSDMSAREMSQFRLGIRETMARRSDARIDEVKAEGITRRTRREQAIRQLELADRKLREIEEETSMPLQTYQEWAKELLKRPQDIEINLLDADPQTANYVKILTARLNAERIIAGEEEWLGYEANLIQRLEHAKKIWAFEAKRGEADLKEIDAKNELRMQERATGFANLRQLGQGARTSNRDRRSRVQQAHAVGVQRTEADKSFFAALDQLDTVPK